MRGRFGNSGMEEREHSGDGRGRQRLRAISGGLTCVPSSATAYTALALSRLLGSWVSLSMQGPGAGGFVLRQGRFLASKPALQTPRLAAPQMGGDGVTTCVGVEDQRGRDNLPETCRKSDFFLHGGSQG